MLQRPCPGRGERVAYLDVASLDVASLDIAFFGVTFSDVIPELYALHEIPNEFCRSFCVCLTRYYVVII